MRRNMSEELQLVEQVNLGMFLIHLIFLLNYDLSTSQMNKRSKSISHRIRFTLNDPVDARLALAVDANEPRLGCRLKLVSLP